MTGELHIPEARQQGKASRRITAAKRLLFPVLFVYLSSSILLL
jgi:hypothetical protein